MPETYCGRTVLERQGHLVRLQGIDGWLDPALLRPCPRCQGRTFRVGRGRIFCTACVPPRSRAEAQSETLQMPPWPRPTLASLRGHS
jgi:hypothetical protein